MPNNVYCSLKFSYHEDNGEMIEKIQRSIKGENGDIDFNTLIKQPDGIQSEKAGVLSWAERDWCIANWGTKWNAYSIKLMSKEKWSIVFHFETDWNMPEPIINKILEMFPDVHICFTCADDGGWFANHIDKPPNESAIFNEWTADKKNDEGGTIRRAIFESLNTKY